MINPVQFSLSPLQYLEVDTHLFLSLCALYWRLKDMLPKSSPANHKLLRGDLITLIVSPDNQKSD